jgi:hypothetical protein
MALKRGQSLILAQLDHTVKYIGIFALALSVAGWAVGAKAKKLKCRKLISVFIRG